MYKGTDLQAKRAEGRDSTEAYSASAAMKSSLSQCTATDNNVNHHLDKLSTPGAGGGGSGGEVMRAEL